MIISTPFCWRYGQKCYDISWKIKEKITLYDFILNTWYVIFFSIILYNYENCISLFIFLAILKYFTKLKKINSSYKIFSNIIL